MIRSTGAALVLGLLLCVGGASRGGAGAGAGGLDAPYRTCTRWLKAGAYSARLGRDGPALCPEDSLNHGGGGGSVRDRCSAGGGLCQLLGRGLRLRGGIHAGGLTGELPKRYENVVGLLDFNNCGFSDDEGDEEHQAWYRRREEDWNKSKALAPPGTVCVPTDSCLCQAVQQSPPGTKEREVLVQRGWYDAEFDVEVGGEAGPLRVEGEWSDSEGWGEELEHIRAEQEKPKIRMIDTETRHSMVICHWFLNSTSRGIFRDIHMLEPHDKPNDAACVRVEGSPWVFTRAKIACCEGVVVSCEGNGGVVVQESVLEGLDSKRFRASVCLSCKNTSCARTYRSILQDSYGPNVHVSGSGVAHVTNSTLQYGLFGVLLCDNSTTVVKGTWIRRQKDAVFSAFPGTEGPGCYLGVRGSFGIENGNVWASGRRPGRLLWARNHFGYEDEDGLAPIRERECDWMKTALLDGLEHTIRRKDHYTADQWNKGADVRQMMYDYNKEELNRDEGWLGRRKFSKKVVTYLDDAALRAGDLDLDNYTAREVDSDEELYDDDIGMKWRPRRSEPVVMALQEDMGQADYKVETVQASKFSTLDVDLACGTPARVKTTEKNKVYDPKHPSRFPRSKFIQGQATEDLPFEYKRQKRTGINTHQIRHRHILNARTLPDEPKGLEVIGEGEQLEDIRHELIQQGRYPISLREARMMLVKQARENPRPGDDDDDELEDEPSAAFSDDDTWAPSQGDEMGSSGDSYGLDDEAADDGDEDEQDAEGGLGGGITV